MSDLIHHLPVLLILWPLLAAVICFLVKNRTVLWCFGMMVTAVQLCFSALIFLFIYQDIFIHYELGAWPSPWGIELTIDYLNAFILIIVTGIAFFCSWHFKHSCEYEVSIQKANLFYCAFLLNLAGLSGVILTGDAFNLFVFIEISAISSYALVAMGNSKQSLVSAYEYLVMGTIGATFTLIGLGFLYVMTGTLNMGDLAQRIPDVSNTSTVWVALCFILIGLFIKLALYPLHNWLPSVYQTSPNIITVYFSATTTKVFIYVLCRYVFTIFDYDFVVNSAVPFIMSLMACLAILYGSWKAITASGLKLIFAYSSVAQIGYMVLGLSLMDHNGLTASVLFMLNHAVIKAGIYLTIALFLLRLSTDHINKLPRMSAVFPYTYAVFIVLGLALIGIPGTAGFISKWYLVQAVIEQQLWPMLAVIVIGSLLSVIYFWRIIEAVSFRGDASGEVSTVKQSATPYMSLAAITALLLINFYLGLQGDYFIQAATTLSEYLISR